MRSPYTLLPCRFSKLGTSHATNFVAIAVLISVLFLIFVFNADSRAEGVEFQTILSASRLSDIFLMRLSVASVVFVSGA